MIKKRQYHPITYFKISLVFFVALSTQIFSLLKATYLKISPAFFKDSFTQFFSLIDSTLADRKVGPFLKMGKLLKRKVEKDLEREAAGVKKSESRIIRFTRLGFKVLVWVYWRIYFIYSYNKASIENCRHLFYNHLIPNKTKEIALFGISDIAKIIIIIAKQTSIRIAGVYDDVEGLKFAGHSVSHFIDLRDYQGKVLISYTLNIEEKIKKLKKLGIKEENILLM